MAKKLVQGATAPVPQNRDEAARFLAEIGQLARDAARMEADLNEKITKSNNEAEEAIAPLRARFKERVEGLQAYCDANREQLTDGFKTKTVDLGTGKVSWRSLPASVSLRGVEKIIAMLRASRSIALSGFVRTKYEVDKEAMLKNPEAARKIAGVTIKPGAEEFYFEPLNEALRVTE